MKLIDIKLDLLIKGLDIDFDSVSEFLSGKENNYKINRLKVSDRHFLAPKDKKRDLIPDELIIKKGKEETLVKTYYNPQSEIKLRNDLQLFQGGQRLPAKVSLVPMPFYSKASFSGYELNYFLGHVGVDRVSVIPFDGCMEWLKGTQCKFCGANPARLGFDRSPTNIMQIKEYNSHEEWWADKKGLFFQGLSLALKRLKENPIGPHLHLAVMVNNLSHKKDTSWKIALETAKEVQKTLELSKVDSYLNIMPPVDFSLIEEAKELGFQNTQFNLEVWNKELFKNVCPGKAEYGRERIIKALKYAVKIFGEGKARSNFVLGAEPVESLIKGARKLGKEGIAADYSIFFPRPGSVWRSKSSPSREEILKTTRAFKKIYEKYNFQPIYCGLSSRSSLMNEAFYYE